MNEKLSKLDLALIQETHPELVIRNLARETRLLRDENERLEKALRVFLEKALRGQ